MKQTCKLICGDSLEWLKKQPKHSLFIVTDMPLNIPQRPIYEAAHVYMIYGGVSYLVGRHRPGEERIPGEKVVTPYEKVLEVLYPTTIVDPFMGTGTIGEAALKAGHSFIGIEIDPARYEICAERLKLEKYK